MVALDGAHARQSRRSGRMRRSNPVADELASKPRRLDDEDADPSIGVAVEGLVVRHSDRLDLKPSFSAETGRDPFRKAMSDS